MAEKRKISIRKILQVLLTIVASTGCIIAMVSASRIEDNKKVKSVMVHLKDDKKYHFIEQREIVDLGITNRDVDIEHTPLSKLDLHGIEKAIRSNPWVAYAQVYIDNERVMHIHVTQRIPVVRVFQQNNSSFYMDTTLSIMPLSATNIYYASVVTNVPELKNDSAGWAMRQHIVSLVRNIQSDSFWSAQVSQIIVDSASEFELVPVLGDHRIFFGDATDMKEKFDNLFLFYKNVLNRIGWDKYQTLDLRFKGQVIAAPSLPYKGPVDKAVVNMNWINSIVESEAKNAEIDSVKTETKKAAPADKVKLEEKKDLKKPEANKKDADKAKAKPADDKKAKDTKADNKGKKDERKTDKDKKNPDKKVADKKKEEKKGDVKSKKETDKKASTPKYQYNDKKKDH